MILQYYRKPRTKRTPELVAFVRQEFPTIDHEARLFQPVSRQRDFPAARSKRISAKPSLKRTNTADTPRVKRKRGRPRKTNTPAALITEPTFPAATPKRRGRPRKHASHTAHGAAEPAEQSVPPALTTKGRGRGRGRGGRGRGRGRGHSYGRGRGGMREHGATRERIRSSVEARIRAGVPPPNSPQAHRAILRAERAEQARQATLRAREQAIRRSKQQRDERRQRALAHARSRTHDTESTAQPRYNLRSAGSPAHTSQRRKR